MRSKFYLIAVMAALGVLLLQAPVPAGITKCFFNVFTTNYPADAQPPVQPTPFQLNFYVEIGDTKYRPPEALSLFKIKTPDGTIYDYSADYWNYYDEFGDYFYITLPASAVQQGKYTLTVRDKSVPRVTIVNSDTFTLANTEPLVPPQNLSFLNSEGLPTPLIGATNVPLETTFNWNSVPGAQCYRIELFSGLMPVYQRDKNLLQVYKNFFVVPRGVLKSNRNYTLRVEARDSDKNVNRRSRTLWINFTTAP